MTYKMGMRAGEAVLGESLSGLDAVAPKIAVAAVFTVSMKF